MKKILLHIGYFRKNKNIQKKYDHHFYLSGFYGTVAVKPGKETRKYSKKNENYR